MPCQKLLDYLDAHHIHYTRLSHPASFTAQKTAHLAHVSGKEMAKTIIVKINGDLKMAVLPANQMLNIRLLKNLYSTEDVELARESEFAELFSDCELGAMPPFGNLYGVEEFVSEELTRDDEIAFNAGTHTEVIKMKYHDFEKLVKPKILNFKIEL